MGQGEESGILDKIPPMDFRDPLGDRARWCLGALTRFFLCCNPSFGRLEIRLHGLQVLTVLVTQISLAGAFHHRPIGKDLIPLLRVGFGLHRKQMRRGVLAYAHIFPPALPFVALVTLTNRRSGSHALTVMVFGGMSRRVRMRPRPS